MIQLLCSHGPACAVICIVARGCALALPAARIELVLAAGAVGAALVLSDAWARQPDRVALGGVRAIAAAAACALVTWSSA